jgi:hypothetical protein
VVRGLPSLASKNRFPGAWEGAARDSVRNQFAAKSFARNWDTMVMQSTMFMRFNAVFAEVYGHNRHCGEARLGSPIMGPLLWCPHFV